LQASSLLFTYKRACQLFKPGVSRHKIYYTFGYLQALFLVFAAIIIKKRFFLQNYFLSHVKRFFMKKKRNWGGENFVVSVEIGGDYNLDMLKRMGRIL